MEKLYQEVGRNKDHRLRVVARRYPGKNDAPDVRTIIITIANDRLLGEDDHELERITYIGFESDNSRAIRTAIDRFDHFVSRSYDLLTTIIERSQR